MLQRQTIGVKTIKSDDAFDFDSRLNSFIKNLDKKGISYEVKVDPTAGLLAFVTYREVIKVAENVAEEYQLVGDFHHCNECPFYVRPTKGNVKWTRCGKGVLRSAESQCCDEFYELMDKGELEPKPIADDWKGGK